MAGNAPLFGITQHASCCVCTEYPPLFPAPLYPVLHVTSGSLGSFPGAPNPYWTSRKPNALSAWMNLILLKKNHSGSNAGTLSNVTHSSEITLCHSYLWAEKFGIGLISFQAWAVSELATSSHNARLCYCEKQRIMLSMPYRRNLLSAFLPYSRNPEVNHGLDPNTVDKYGQLPHSV